MLKVKRPFEAYLDEMNKITILLPHTYGTSRTFFMQEGNHVWELKVAQIISLADVTKYECYIEYPLDVGKYYTVRDERNEETDLQIGAVIRTAVFDEKYYYDGSDLGACYRKEKTTFKIWAPTARLAKVRIYKNDKEYTDYEMQREENGVWSCILQGDFELARYTFLVCINLIWNEVVDPYAKSVSVNGKYGIVIDLAKTYVKEQTSLPKLESFTDAILYELHIRDATMHPNSGVEKKGTYTGLTEENTKGRLGTETAFSYIKGLGVTHVELLPLHHFAGVDETTPFVTYNWGYNPLYYNVPTGVYASDPTDPYNRIKECKQLIEKFHEHGLRVILDVVYNHVYERETSSFEKLVPGYYFRHDENGMPSNGTGVGNDLASERKMMRKFIIDSVLYWLTEYNVDGFRFDLMGILDVETMNELEKEIRKRKKDALLLGEGWDLQTPLPAGEKATLNNANKMPQIAQFNDQFRDGIKGSTFDVSKRGFAFGGSVDPAHLQYVLTGSLVNEKGDGLFLEPIQSINYVECHDNMTMWDKLVRSNQETEEVQKRRHRLATAMTLLSQGIPFLHAGQEFYRSKKGNENSYNALDEINQLDWDQKEKEIETIAYIQGLIAIRKAHRAFRLQSANLIKKHMTFLQTSPTVVAYHLQNIGKFGPWKEIVVLFHNGVQLETISLPKHEMWYVLADSTKAKVHPISSFQGSELQMVPISSYILAIM
ncbi:type I pullulanase [Bacillus pseudomycoides]|uniref:type I pullulanase n=1 Tax=Bacillus pseudomycoides TaxID=64104 RepID=UPI000BEB7499|nr:type I pullulanase [Bacillus pseudomycoides]PED06520.1 type I pullulanase [Bacillus pseudomycoides]PEI92853.1 type I pullulanase [Bacillus pseudomycoides]PEK18730.1 type I pullulanase [Bacillus pseudomycoides]PEM69115.1 type I pullulanase [Bacillus pseudomycoides]PEO19290.1 type I pullulanase [Bacillus pseudomycoides]